MLVFCIENQNMAQINIFSLRGEYSLLTGMQIVLQSSFPAIHKVDNWSIVICVFFRSEK